MGLAEKLAARPLGKLEPYQSARRIGVRGDLYLNANESPYPPYQMPDGESWQRYPDFLPQELARCYADYAGVAPDQVIATRGADEGIDLMLRAFCDPGTDAIRVCPPTYAMYEFIARAHQVEVMEVPLTRSFSLDAVALGAPRAYAKMLFLCHPNNPTGNLLDRDTIIGLAQAHSDDALIVVDEAYIEYCPEHSLAPLIAHYPNLVVLRTLSKAFALAAVRIGFILAHPEVVALVAKLIAPYPIPDPCARIALNSLSEAGVAYMEAQRDLTLQHREQYAALIKELPCIEQVYPSATNFLLLKCSDSDRVFAHLSQQGIVLRDQARALNLAGHLRITVGQPGEMDRVIDSLRKLD